MDLWYIGEYIMEMDVKCRYDGTQIRRQSRFLLIPPIDLIQYPSRAGIHYIVPVLCCFCSEPEGEPFSTVPKTY